MEAERKLASQATVNEEADRIREIFKESFQQTDGSLERLFPSNFTETIAQRAETGKPADDDFDWSVTLANVEAIVDASNASRSAIVQAEMRAEIAEAKAKEALHWLRTLHNAVLKGLPR
ncbi:hypothetical protein [Methylobacterium sp. 37f]|uniref:hypothetical protein n=1 Tax=Methylobacterium sp. 37f TaxID=2817058 RepID=UPI001FFCD4DC|nr:hypothetical protein [Methylobacterium sp. 37f]MCK2056455.1 hypothetical protein [Methylobacterium sp. 37f]